MFRLEEERGDWDRGRDGGMVSADEEVVSRQEMNFLAAECRSWDIEDGEKMRETRVGRSEGERGEM